MLTKTLAENKVTFTFTETYAEKRQADFGNLAKPTTNKTKAAKQSQSKPLPSETQAKNLEELDKPETQTAEGW